MDMDWAVNSGNVDGSTVANISSCIVTLTERMNNNETFHLIVILGFVFYL